MTPGLDSPEETPPTPEPTMSVFATAAADIEAFRNKLTADAQHLIGEFEALLGKLKGDAEQDAADVVKKIEPVVAEAEADAGALASEAVSGAEGIVDPAKPSA